MIIIIWCLSFSLLDSKLSINEQLLTDVTRRCFCDFLFLLFQMLTFLFIELYSFKMIFRISSEYYNSNYDIIWCLLHFCGFLNRQ